MSHSLSIFLSNDELLLRQHNDVFDCVAILSLVDIHSLFLIKISDIFTIKCHVFLLYMCDL